ncbi:MAG TPA: c-type cytochrome [Chitinophagales bacterium]|nr:c-type cytochrome [Chitinophagales bacterium]
MYYKIYGLFAIIAIAIIACQPTTKESKNVEPVVMSQEEMAARGKYLVSILDCNICHTPKIFTPDGPVPDTTKILSGHPADFPEAPFDQATVGAYTLANAHFSAWKGAFGTSYAANLTPDSTGLATWNVENFINAIRNGKHMGMDQQRPIMPPMPWQAYRNLSDEDLKAIWAYLQSLPPIKNAVPVYMPPMQSSL